MANSLLARARYQKLSAPCKSPSPSSSCHFKVRESSGAVRCAPIHDAIMEWLNWNSLIIIAQYLFTVGSYDLETYVGFSFFQSEPCTTSSHIFQLNEIAIPSSRQPLIGTRLSTASEARNFRVFPLLFVLSRSTTILSIALSRNCTAPASADCSLSGSPLRTPATS